MYKVTIRLCQLMAISSLLNLIGILMKSVTSVDISLASRKRIIAGFALAALTFILAIVWPLILLSLIAEVVIYFRNRLAGDTVDNSAPAKAAVKRPVAQEEQVASALASQQHREQLISDLVRAELLSVARELNIKRDVLTTKDGDKGDIMVVSEANDNSFAFRAHGILAHSLLSDFVRKSTKIVAIEVDAVNGLVTWQVIAE